MKKVVLTLFLIFLGFSSFAQWASFDNFEYIGKDTVSNYNIKTDVITNPLFCGFYPDPSICRKGKDYYLINSSFSYFPGIPIFHSKNLKDWNQLGYVLDRKEQLNLEGIDLSSGVYAPDISYNPYNDTFYVVNTVVNGIGNFLVKTKNPKKGWGNPVKLPKVIGIDPSIFYDDDGKAYILSSHLPPKSEWDGHRAIYIYDFDYKNDTTSNPVVIIDGGYDRESHPKWLEGPHLYKKDGSYYMIMAEGGTHSGHRQVAFRSDNIKGPYEACPINPILSQLDLQEERPDKVINVGHADMVETDDGEWFSVFLGCRPYEGKLYNTGRETFLLPVNWVDNSPVILEKGKPVPNMNPQNIVWKDEFKSSKLDLKWNGIRSLNDQWFNISKGKLKLKLLPFSLGEKKEVAFLGRRQQNLSFSSSVDISYIPNDENEFAGMILLQNETNYIAVGLTVLNDIPVIAAIRNENGDNVILASVPIDSSDKMKLHIEANGGKGNLSFSYNDIQHILASDIDITHLSTDKAKGFVGCYVGMYATSAFPKQVKTLYVSTDGNDLASGNYSEPVATAEMALEKAKPYLGKYKVDIIFKDGTYYFDKTLNLDYQYSANEEYPLTFKAEHAGMAVWSGGESLQLKWEPFRDGIFKAEVSEKIENIDQLYVNGISQRMARFPNAIENKNVFDTWNLKEEGQKDQDPLSKDRMKLWKNPSGAYVHAMHSFLWGDMHWLVKGFENDSTLSLEGGWQNNRPSPMHHTYRMIENVFEELDVPNEWYFDNKNHILYYYPDKDTDLSSAKVEMVKLESLVELHGDMQNPVRNVNFEGLLFRHTARTFMKNKEPLLRSDWTVYRNGTLLFAGAEGCTVENCEFDQVGGNSIVVSNFNKDINIKSCYIHHSGANGIVFVGNPDMVRSPLFGYVKQNYQTMDRTPGPLGFDFPQECKVEDCLITRTGRHEKQTAPVQISMSYRIKISHCSIYDVPRAGINISEGTFGGHIIENCDVFDTVLETGDHGSFNSWGRDRYWTGDVPTTAKEVDLDPSLSHLDMIEGNIIRNSRWRCDHGWDIDLDDGSSFYHIYNNVLLNGGLKLREGYGRKVENNIILNNSLHPHVWYHNSCDVVEGNIFYTHYYPAIMNKDIAENEHWGKSIDKNFFNNDEDRIKYFKNNCDKNSWTCQLNFENAIIGDYFLAENSLPLKHGFQNIPNDFGVVSPRLKAIARHPVFPSIIISDSENNINNLQKWHGVTIKIMETQGELSALGYKEISGVIVIDVSQSSPWHGKLFQGDLIIGSKGKKVACIEDLPTNPDQLIIWRNQQEHTIK